MESLLPLLVYILPLFAMLKMSIDIFTRNPRNIENRLLTLVFCAYASLFLAEYVRHELPIDYSPVIVNFWFANSGLLLVSFFLHFVLKFTGFSRHFRFPYFPMLCYLPVIPIFITIIFRTNFLNSSDFEQVGIFYYPVYNINYIVTLTCSLIFFIIILPLLIYSLNGAPQQKRSIMKILIATSVLVLIWTIAFGYFDYKSIFPPYSYIYVGLFLAIALRISMYKYQFIESPEIWMSTLFRMNPLAMFIVNRDGFIQMANPSAHALLNKKKLRNQYIFQFVPKSLRKDALQTFKTSFETKTSLENVHMQIIAKGSQHKHVMLNGGFITMNFEETMILIIHNIHDMKKTQLLNQHLAYTDSLTGLPNRRLFMEYLESKIHNKEQISLIVIDLDDFKRINDHYGHQIGDKLLRHFASLLQQQTRITGTVARVGGDEFYACIVYEELGEILEWIDHLLATIKHRPLQTNKGAIYVYCSIGFSLYPLYATNMNQLIQQADKAMYRNKKTGETQATMFDASIDDDSV